MQQGSVIREHRKLGPDVWCFRWWEAGPNGNSVHRRIVLGTVEQMRDAASARQLTFGLVQEINTTDIRSGGISMTEIRKALKAAQEVVPQGSLAALRALAIEYLQADGSSTAH